MTDLVSPEHKHMPRLFNLLQKMWSDVEELDLRADHRGQLCAAMANLQMADELQKLRLTVDELIDVLAPPEPEDEELDVDIPAPQMVETEFPSEKAVFGPVKFPAVDISASMVREAMESVKYPHLASLAREIPTNDPDRPSSHPIS